MGEGCRVDECITRGGPIGPAIEHIIRAWQFVRTNLLHWVHFIGIRNRGGRIEWQGHCTTADPGAGNPALNEIS